MHVYIHVPFCQSRCVYCDFYVVLAKYGGQDAFVDALCREIRERWQDQKALASIETLYIGGGTPSLLPASAYKTIFSTIQAFTDLSPSAEITLEFNPQDFASPASAYRDLGINRASLGIQSFDALELKKLSRRHNPDDAKAAVGELKAGAFDNISIDLMHGIPCQTKESWQESLQAAIDLDIQHISMYGLQLEDGTPLERLVEKTKHYPLPEDEQSVELYFEGLSRLESAGFKRYEFSNLAQPGFESRHNLAYWENKDYWAFGPGAHGYIHPKRYANQRDLQGYIENPTQAEEHRVSLREQMENHLIFGLRKAEGISISGFEARYEMSLHNVFSSQIQSLLDKGQLIQEEERLFIPESWIVQSNEILAQFIN